ncbi:MAG: aldehyde ferredoxin oxidoreductase C-terminal domain-containing protein, partial [Dehalococcoidia bacterium]
PEAANTAEPSKNIPTLDYYVAYLNATTGSNKKLKDVLADSERLYILQKLINLSHGKGTRASDQIPLRAMGPVYLNEYEARAGYYEEWLREQDGIGTLPASTEEKHKLLMEKRVEAYRRLCDIVYENKGFTPEGIPKRETVEKFGLLDERADKLLREFNI